MRKAITLMLLLAMLGLPGCAAVKNFNVKVAKDATVTLAQAQAGLEYLQATYVRLQAAGAIPSLAALSTDIANLAAVITKGDLGAAVALYAAGRDEVTKVSEAMGK